MDQIREGFQVLCRSRAPSLGRILGRECWVVVACVLFFSVNATYRWAISPFHPIIWNGCHLWLKSFLHISLRPCHSLLFRVFMGTLSVELSIDTYFDFSCNALLVKMMWSECEQFPYKDRLFASDLWCGTFIALPATGAGGCLHVNLLGWIERRFCISLCCILVATPMICHVYSLYIFIGSADCSQQICVHGYCWAFIIISLHHVSLLLS